MNNNEAFSRKRNNHEVRKQISYGIEEYFQSKLDLLVQERQERQEKFQREYDIESLNRFEFERRVNNFVIDNIDMVIDAIIDESLGDRFNKFGLSNKDLRDFGFDDVSILVKKIVDDRYNQTEIINKEVYNEETGNSLYTDEIGDSGEIFDYNKLAYKAFNVTIDYSSKGSNSYHYTPSLASYLAAAYLKENITFDSKTDVGILDNSHTYNRRYYDKKLERYLGKNDFGMKPYGGESNVEDIGPYAQSVKRKIMMMLTNINRLQKIIQSQSNYSLSDEDVKKLIGKDNILKILSDAIPYNKFFNEVFSKNRQAINDYVDKNNIDSKDLYAKHNFVKSKKFQKHISDVVLSNIQEFPGEVSNLYVAHSKGHNKPIILNSEEYKFINESLQHKTLSKIEQEIINNCPNEDLKSIARGIDSGRGYNSPYSFSQFDLYEAVKKIGAKKFYELYPQAKETIENNSVYYDLNMNEFIEEINDLSLIFGDQLRKMEANQINKERWHSRVLNESRIWNYFASRAVGMEVPTRRSNEDYGEYEDRENEYESRIHNFLVNLSQAERKNLFYEGKKMYWLTKQIRQRVYEFENRNTENDDEGFKFYNEHWNIDWKQYDSKGIDADKLFEYFKTHGNIICTLLSKESSNQGNQNISFRINIKTIMQIIDAIEAGADLRGVALAYDKQKYVEAVLSGNEEKNNIEFALQDWPKKLRDKIIQEEFEIYYEYAEEYLYQDPNGMLRYAQVILDEPHLRSLFGNSVERKSDMDLRLSLSAQTPEVRGWYSEGAKYVGHQTLQKYFVRFNATQKQDGGYPDLHDALYWMPNIKKLTQGEAKSLLSDVQTVDESNEFRNFLQRYNKEKDQLSEKEGPIRSLRDLKKRVFALESNIDISKLPPEIINILSAPGLNLSALEKIRGQDQFKKLENRELDKIQPFKPFSKTYTEKPLNEALSSGLGSYSKKIKGSAKNPKKLFSEVRALMKGKEIDGRKMQIQDLLKEIPRDMEEDILKLLRDHGVQTGAIFEAKLLNKSDPEGWVCGNYTDCCMSFGTTVNDNFIFNEGTQYFVVKYNNRIIAQSVVVDSINNTTNEDIIVLDNIEIANNYKNRSPILARIYKDFWSEYSSKEVKIGTGYNDLVPAGAYLEDNNYSPKHTLGYSDATGSKIYNLPKIKGIESMDQIITFANLTERDAKIIEEMEKEIYTENMAQGKENIINVIRKQKELDVPGAASSFILRKGNKPVGYLLLLPEKSKLNNSETVAHIHDMAVLPEYQDGKIAKKMMERLFETAIAYDVPAIEFEARERTSYRLITHPRISKWIESHGFKLVYNEKLPEYLDGEDFYFVRLEKIEVNR